MSSNSSMKPTSLHTRRGESPGCAYCPKVFSRRFAQSERASQFATKCALSPDADDMRSTILALALTGMLTVEQGDPQRAHLDPPSAALSEDARFIAFTTFAR